MREWQPVHYSDHLGHPVVLEELISPGFEESALNRVPIPVYSTVPLDEDHSILREYLLNSFIDEEIIPLFEIYSYCPPDSFACIEYHRREIAYRKEQTGTPNAVPLIPQFSDGSMRSPIGLCILLRSHSYRLGWIEDPDEYEAAGDSPDWLFFSRAYQSHVPSTEPGGKIELHLGGFELSIRPVRNQRDIGPTIVCDIVTSVRIKDHYCLDYGLDQNEGLPFDAIPLSKQQIRQQLDQQDAASTFTLNQTFLVSHEANAVSVTNTKGSEPDLQYIILVPFLSHLREDETPALLEATARLFTSSLMSHLPTKTLNLKFWIPETNSWSAILPAYRDAHQNTPFSIGALHTLTARGDDHPTVHRLFPHNMDPAYRGAYLIRNNGDSAVFIDRANFLRDPGVCFYMTEYLDDDDLYRDGADRPETNIQRSPDMAEVAYRMAMRMAEEPSWYDLDEDVNASDHPTEDCTDQTPDVPTAVESRLP
ncbi:hypothetical protein BJX99DRAFT_227192 [Aspergillus californicus]